MPGGRPTRLTAKLSTEIAEAVKSTGCKPHHAAIRAGVPLGTFQGWQKVAKRAEGKSARQLTQMERRCLELSRELARATATYLIGLESIIARTIAGVDAHGSDLNDPRLQVRTAMWVLERRLPEEYGRRQQGRVTVDEPAPVAGDLASALQKLARLRGRGQVYRDSTSQGESP